MAMSPSEVLKELRDTLRTPASLPDSDTFLYHLSTTLQALHIHPTSIAPEHIPKDVLKGISRYLSSVQIALVTTLPNFLHLLDERQTETVKGLFVPRKKAERSVLPIKRAIALNTYLTINSLLSSNTSDKLGHGVPISLRDFVLKTAEHLVKEYSIDEMYWAVWSTSSGLGGGMQTLQWEDTVKAIIGLPGKVANAVGRWKADGWSGDVPAGLIPRWVGCRLDSIKANEM
jgi:telomere length regulation protein